MASMKVGAPAPPAETLPCPRCESKNTKFCYYNNYNFSQPRYYCKSCRRYWTHGGTLRNVPVGGGSRKSAKRSRTSSPSSSSSSSTAVSPAAVTTTVGPAYPVYSGQLSSFLALSGFGLGLGLDEGRFGFGLGGSGWMMPENGYLGGATGGGGNAGVSGGGGGGNGGGEGWNVESGVGGGGGDGGDYYSALPELAISTPGNVLN